LEEKHIVFSKKQQNCNKIILIKYTKELIFSKKISARQAPAQAFKMLVLIKLKVLY
jgi:hypothetical protein